MSRLMRGRGVLSGVWFVVCIAACKFNMASFVFAFRTRCVCVVRCVAHIVQCVFGSERIVSLVRCVCLVGCRTLLALHGVCCVKVG